eukprot:3884264-Rhodomonas_salina.3
MSRPGIAQLATRQLAELIGLMPACARRKWHPDKMYGEGGAFDGVETADISEEDKEEVRHQTHLAPSSACSAPLLTLLPAPLRSSPLSSPYFSPLIALLFSPLHSNSYSP